MSEQNPHNPYPPSAGYSQPGTAGPGVSYAQQSMPYPGMPQAAGSVRPGAATGASVLGIISGSLGLIAAILSFIALSALQALASALGAGTVLIIGWIEVIAIFITAVTLLASGIMFLKGNGGKALLNAAIA